MATNWRKTDQRLIRRGELILELSFVENYQNELDAMNHGKEGRPYKLTPTYIQFLTAFRILHSVPYHQLEGFTKALHRLVPQLPPGDYSGLRKRSLNLNPDPYQALKETDKPITIAVDSTGVKVRLAGGWVERETREEEAVREAPLRRGRGDEGDRGHDGVHGRCARCQGLSGSGERG